jgi:hypothetical protein
MASPNLSVSFTTVTAPGTFFVHSEGYIQGHILDNPVELMRIAGGVVASTETFPMWAGVGIYEDIPYPYPNMTAPADQLGSIVGRATSISGTNPLRGFTVANQAHAMLITPQSEAAAMPAGGTVNFVRLGSGVRLALACDPSLTSLEGGDIGQAVSWDFSLQRVIPFVAAYAQNAVTAASWASTNGGQITFTTTSSTGIVAGDDFTTAGFTPAGYNATWTAITGTSGTTLVVASTTNPGSATTLGYVTAGGGALPVKVLGFSPTGSGFTIYYDQTLGYVHYNRSGTCVVVQI